MQPHRAMLIVVPVAAVVATVAYHCLQSPEVAGRDNGAAADQPQSSVAPSGAARVDDISALREEVASLRTELLRRDQINRSGPSAGDGQQPQLGSRDAAGSHGESVADPRTKAMIREEAARERQVRITTIDASFRKEVIDPTWSANISSSIQSVLGSDEVGRMQADSIDCRSQTCRVELHDTGSGRLNRNVSMMVLQLAGALPNMTANSEVRPDGGVSMVLYLSRQQSR